MIRLTPADLRWFENWGPSHYDPDRGEIVIVGDPPPYALAHERQHQRQHQQRTFLYLLWQFIGAIQPPFLILNPIFRFLRRATRLLLEIDADLRARAELRDRGQWDIENQKAALLVMRSYLCPDTLR